MQTTERTRSRRASTLPTHRHQPWNNIEMLKVNWDQLPFTTALARERSLSPVHFFADTTPLEQDFGFRPATPLRDDLRAFAQWYAKYYGTNE